MTKRPEHINDYSILDEILCRFFRFDPERVGYTESTEMLFIYRFVQRSHQTVTVNETLGAMGDILATLHAQSRRERLYKLFLLCQAESSRQAGLAAPESMKPPPPAPLFDNDDE